MSKDLYQKPLKVQDPYDSVEGAVSGVDIRSEITKLLWNDNRGADVIYRRVVMENGHPKKCDCTKKNRSQEADVDIPCYNCGGMGYYYNDIVVRTLINHSQAYSIYKKVKPEGSSQVEYKTAYFEWDFLLNSVNDGDNIPNRFDRIIQLRKDLSGKIQSPSSEREVYEILSVDPYRLDNNGRIEYYRIRIISVVDKSFLV